MRRFFSTQIAKKGRAAILDGAGVSKAWQKELQQEAAEVRRRLGRPPGLAVVIVGDRADSEIYVQRKQDACSRVGIASSMKRLRPDASQAELEGVVRSLCGEPGIDGVLVQLPLPEQFDEEAVIDAFEPGKDVDGFHPLNVGRLIMRNRQRSLVPCTALGCMELLSRSEIDLRGKEAVLLGDSNVVGTPLAMLLRGSGVAALTLCSRPSMQALFDGRERERGREIGGEADRAPAEPCLPRLPGPSTAPLSDLPEADGHPTFPVGPSGRDNDASHQGNTHAARDSDSFDLPAITSRADLLVVAVGNPELVRADWVKPGAVVLDVGINVVGGENRKSRVVGDVAFDEVSEVAAAITPVPGGVGPMTIAAVLHNTIQAAWLHAGEQHEPSCRFADAL